MDQTFPPPHANRTRPATVAVPLTAALEGAVVARQSAQRVRLSPQAAALTDLADALEHALPPVIPRSALAQALGVTPKTVTRWAAAGRVPLERPHPQAQLGVPTPFALAVVAEAERLRHLMRQRRTRLIGHALRTAGRSS